MMLTSTLWCMHLSVCQDFIIDLFFFFFFLIPQDKNLRIFDLRAQLTAVQVPCPTTAFT